MATSAEPLEGLHCTKSTTCNSPHTCLCQSQKHFTTKSIYKLAKFYLAWENSHNFATGGGGWEGEELLTTGFPRKWHLRNDCRNSILIMHLGSASGWLCCLGIFLQPVRSATQICTVFSMEFLHSSFRPPRIVLFVFVSSLCCTNYLIDVVISTFSLQVIIIEPFFDCYVPQIAFAGGVPKFVTLKPVSPLSK